MTQPLMYTQTYPQQGSANAVSINIYNPQAYGSAPQMVPQQLPYNYTNSFYQMPQTNVYPQQQSCYSYPQQQSYYSYPQRQSYCPYPQYAPTNSIIYQPAAPAPQIVSESVMPDSVMSQSNIIDKQEAYEQGGQVQQTAPMPEIITENPNVRTIDIKGLVQGLESDDADIKARTINQIAEYAQDEPAIAKQVLSTPIMDGLVNVINEDTTNLEGPTARQIEIAEKIAKNKKLTPEEDALSEQLSPRDKANKNRIFALYTLAMLQKLQREEIYEYNEIRKANGAEPIKQIGIEEMNGFYDMANIIQNDPRPEVKVAALQALKYVAEPADREVVEAVLADSLNSKDKDIQAAAQEVIEKFAMM